MGPLSRPQKEIIMSLRIISVFLVSILLFSCGPSKYVIDARERVLKEAISLEKERIRFYERLALNGGVKTAEISFGDGRKYVTYAGAPQIPQFRIPKDAFSSGREGITKDVMNIIGITAASFFPGLFNYLHGRENAKVALASVEAERDENLAMFGAMDSMAYSAYNNASRIPSENNSVYVEGDYVPGTATYDSSSGHNTTDRHDTWDYSDNSTYSPYTLTYQPNNSDNSDHSDNSDNSDNSVTRPAIVPPVIQVRPVEITPVIQ